MTSRNPEALPKTLSLQTVGRRGPPCGRGREHRGPHWP
jgi:hypothetical protein